MWVAKTAERYGYDSILLSDHLMQYARVGDPTEPILESWTTLGAIAVATQKIRIGTLATCNIFRNPAHLAKIVATVDNLSNGRVILGIGAGSLEPEYKVFGFPFLQLRDRIKRLDEALAIILKLWTEDAIDFRGKYFQLRGAFCRPKPIQTPYPQVIIGGNSSPILRLAAKYGIGCNLTGGVENVKSRLLKLRDYCPNGLVYDSLLKTTRVNIIVGRDKSEVRKKIRYYKPKSLTLDYYLYNTIYGTPDVIKHGLQELVDLGFDEIYLAFPDANNEQTLGMAAVFEKVTQ